MLIRKGHIFNDFILNSPRKTLEFLLEEHIKDPEVHFIGMILIFSLSPMHSSFAVTNCWQD
jgi:hypothetical protein